MQIRPVTRYNANTIVSEVALIKTVDTQIVLKP
jgi:hypothetical protein